MINRRDFLGISLGAGATMALTPQLLRALQQGKLIHRAIPSSGEMLPVVGLGFANHALCGDTAALKAVLRTFVDNGGRVFDTNHGNDPGARTQQIHAAVANELGLQDKLFWSLKGYMSSGGRGGPPPGAEALKAHIDSVFATFKVPRIDLLTVGTAAVEDPAQWAVLTALKKEGRIRYISPLLASFGQLSRYEAIMRKEIDFITIDYSVARRDADEQILPLAQERKLGVLAVFPFGGGEGTCPGDPPPVIDAKSLFARVGNTPLPTWAAEFDAKTWAQFFLKYVVSHPAVTAVRTGTTKTHHMLDNIGGGIGRLPDAATRKRMGAFIDAIPAVVPPEFLERFAGEYTAASGLIVTFRRDGNTLIMKSGTNPEIRLAARALNRFATPQGSIVEFQSAVQGTVVRTTGVTLEEGGQKILLERK